jgi:hypothetical protein
MSLQCPSAIDILQTRYPHVQAISQNEGKDVCSHMLICLVALSPESRLGAARVLPRVLWRQLPPPATGQLRSRHVSRDSSSCQLTQGSSGATMCPIELYRLWAIKVNKYPPIVLIS